MRAYFCNPVKQGEDRLEDRVRKNEQVSLWDYREMEMSEIWHSGQFLRENLLYY